MKVLLVDDDPEIRLIVSFLLTDAGHSVAEAADGAAAREAFESLHPDVLLMDVMLGEEDGVEVAAALFRSTGAALPRLIFLTGTTQPAHVARMNAAGAAGLLHKPFDPSTFVARFDHILAGAP